MPGRSLYYYKLCQESDVYFMSTTCGRPKGEGVKSMWMHADRGKAGSKVPIFLWTS